MDDLCARCFPHRQGSDRRVLYAHARQIGNSQVLGSGSSLSGSFKKLAERHNVLLAAQAAFDCVM